jgi:hypothetical protein
VSLSHALSNHLLIVGPPGAGKSTLLRWLAVTFAQRQQQEPNRVGPFADPDRLPILVDLGHLPDRYLKPEGGETPNWFEVLHEYLSKQMAFTKTPLQLLDQALDDGRCLLLFDGLDEVSDPRVRIRLALSLVELARLSSGNRVIISSRLAYESESILSPQFQRCQIEPFTPEQVHRFFRLWYALDGSMTSELQREAADVLYARVHDTPAILELATTPLLSTLLLLIWRKEGKLPSRRVELYERCCQALIEDWENNHHVSYLGILSKIGWERHLRLLAPLAYFIHSQVQRDQLSASKTELIPLLARSLKAEELCSNKSAALLEAEQFLSTLGLRSGLLQYLGEDRYGFPHRTFQEYLAARYIAAQPEPEDISPTSEVPTYIDLIMEHLHEAWWQEVSLLTIAHLGSGNVEARKASALILSILHEYNPPNWILRSSGNKWLRFIGPGRFLPQLRLKQRIAWMLARDLELALRIYHECSRDGTTTEVKAMLLVRTVEFIRYITYDNTLYNVQETLFTTAHEELEILLKDACQLTTSQENKAVIHVLLPIIYIYSAAWFRIPSSFISSEEPPEEFFMQQAMLQILRQTGLGHEKVIYLLLKALNDPDKSVQQSVAEALGRMGVGNEEVIHALLEALQRDPDPSVRYAAAGALERVGVGNEEAMRGLSGAWQYDPFFLVRYQASSNLGKVGEIDKNVKYEPLAVLFKHDPMKSKWHAEAHRLAQEGAVHERVIRGLMKKAMKLNPDISQQELQQTVIESLGRMKIKNQTQLRQVLVILNRLLHNWDSTVRGDALASIRRLLDGRPIPGYRWVPLRKRRARRLRLKRIAFWLCMTVVMVMIALAATWLLGILDPNGLPVRFLVILAGIVAFVAAIAQVLGRTLRDPWDDS